MAGPPRRHAPPPVHWPGRPPAQAKPVAAGQRFAPPPVAWPNGKAPCGCGGGAVQRARMGRNLSDPIPEKLEYDDSTMATTAAILVLRLDAHGAMDPAPVINKFFSSGGGRHAEEKVLLHLQAKVTDGTLTHHNPYSPDYLVVMLVSKSPCSSTSVPATRTDGQPGCKELLEAFMMNGLTNGAGETVIFRLAMGATKPYQPAITGAKQASKDGYNGFGGGPGSGSTFGFVRS